MIKVLKRNGQIVDFNKNKIIEAINKAFLEVDDQLYEDDTAIDIANEIEQAWKSEEPLSVETIQDLVEEYLMRSERKDVARAYIRFRYKKEILRQTSETYDSILSLIE